ncbi:hypothetical protein Bsp3421_002839 [Burkholderia sp. FERM BP-3421]|nr:hypothetical protein [Burkholderia sp. FERM BP-3421]WDD92810.1 hypothetical protein Bsp3421_002839 [Burkholderia sp. FERM BP-3421]
MSEYAYESYLDTDLSFPLNVENLNLNANGRIGFGTINATGRVNVKAEWN